MRYVTRLCVYGMAVYAMTAMLLSALTVPEWQQQHKQYMEEVERYRTETPGAVTGLRAGWLSSDARVYDGRIVYTNEHDI